MILYHCTTTKNAATILREGFRDRTGYYMTRSLHTGVWLSDRPLDDAAPSSDTLVLRLELDEAKILDFEWIEEGNGYREFLIPAAIVNSVPVTKARRRTVHGQLAGFSKGRNRK